MSVRGWLFVLLLLLLGGGGVFAWLRFETSAPAVAGPEAIVFGAQGGTVRFDLSDAGTGLRSVEVVLSHAGGDASLASETYPGGLMSGALQGEQPEVLEVVVPPDALPRGVSDAFLRVTARDWSWRDGLRGNETLADIPLTIDRVPPHVSIATGLTYVKRGGSGAVLYRISEETVRDGRRGRRHPLPELPGGRVARRGLRSACQRAAKPRGARARRGSGRQRDARALAGRRERAEASRGERHAPPELSRRDGAGVGRCRGHRRIGPAHCLPRHQHRTARRQRDAHPRTPRREHTGEALGTAPSTSSKTRR